MFQIFNRCRDVESARTLVVLDGPKQSNVDIFVNLGEKSNLNLDLNFDLQRGKFQCLLMFYTRVVPEYSTTCMLMYAQNAPVRNNIDHYYY